jgi:hypothetical protein
VQGAVAAPLASAAASCSPDGQLQRPGQLHLHRRWNGGTSTATVNLAVNPVNDNPVANPDAASTPINTPAGQHCGAGQRQMLTQPLSSDGSQRQSCRGTVSLNADGTLAPTPAELHQPAVISYSISDGAGGTATSSDGQCGCQQRAARCRCRAQRARRRQLHRGGRRLGLRTSTGQSLANVRIDSPPALGKGTLSSERHG